MSLQLGQLARARPVKPAAAAVDRRDRQSDGQTHDRFTALTDSDSASADRCARL